MTYEGTTGGMRPDERDPETRVDAIVVEIDETRDDMTQTIHAIGEKLEPANVVRGASHAVRDATTGKVEQMTIGARETWDDVTSGNASGIIETIKSNPVPAGMIALGLGMLFLSRGGAATESRARGRYGWSDNASPDRRSRYGGSAYGEASSARTRGSDDTASGAGRSVGYVADRARRTAGNVADSVTEGAGDFADSVGQGASDLADGVGRTAERYSARAGDVVASGSTRFGRMMDENPLVVGIVALAAGAAAGLLIPTTEPERQTLGPVRDRFVEEAGDSVGETLDRVSSRTADQTRSRPLARSADETFDQRSEQLFDGSDGSDQPFTQEGS